MAKHNNNNNNNNNRAAAIRTIELCGAYNVHDSAEELNIKLYLVTIKKITTWKIYL